MNWKYQSENRVSFYFNLIPGDADIAIVLLSSVDESAAVLCVKVSVVVNPVVDVAVDVAIVADGVVVAAAVVMVLLLLAIVVLLAADKDSLVPVMSRGQIYHTSLTSYRL